MKENTKNQKGEIILKELKKTRKEAINSFETDCYI